MIRKTALLAGVAALFATSAYAADLPSYEAPPPVEPVAMAPAFSWTGFYLGAHGGYGWGDVDGDLSETEADPDAEIGSDSFDVDGWLLGAQAGFNYQMGMFVLGLEADASWANIEGDSSVDGFVGPAAVTYESDISVDWLASIRARAGVAFDRVLVFGTGGVAFGGVDGDFAVVDGAGDALFETDVDDTLTGWTVGGGVEFAATNNVTIKGEYLYTDLGDFSSSETIVGDPAIPDGTYEVDSDINIHTVKLGVNYKF